MCCNNRKKRNKRELRCSSKIENKVIFLGDSGVGKSSILQRHIYNLFDEAHEITLGVQFHQSIVNTNAAQFKTNIPLDINKTIALDLWDTAGQERFKSLMPLYYRDTSVSVIVYDVANLKTFEKCSYWVNDLISKEPNCILFLVGNKADSSNKQVSEAMAKKFSKTHNMEWLETSAKSSLNIDLLFRKIAEAIMTKRNTASSELSSCY
ncbi:unnamed protein product [Blepharisma stoltei]|uniref:Uncharacterized protein n=1 Tax=Blepharisma stoltei TaxID=1481888 RepID=A0AAU9JWP3_9CILI|nr:unnamed protein product [Blepharisma stoltei]